MPSYKFVSGSQAFLEEGRASIVKSLTSRRIVGAATLYATRVREDELDPAVPWMIQDYVHASKDITVAYVRGEIFAFELDRQSFIEKTIDWREMGPDAVTDAWAVHELPGSMKEAVKSFMADLCLHYGRLDLLMVEDKYVFLEVNANGEWAWLDFDGKAGLRDRIIEEIHPLTPCHAIPAPRGIVLTSLLGK